mgnify:FL=1
MVRVDGLPLFVLGPDFMPMSSTSLRVFEPRYKQMMDDCILSGEPFGYISQDPGKEDIGGWSQPASYGVMAHIEDYEESGSNILISVSSGLRFRVKEVIRPILDNDIAGMHFPTVDELMDRAGGDGSGKLYVSCDAEIIERIVHNHDQDDYLSFVDYVSPLENLIRVSSMYRGQLLDYDSCSTTEDGDDQERFLWQVSTSLSGSVWIQQQMLAAVTTTDLMQVCVEAANDIMAALSDE